MNTITEERSDTPLNNNLDSNAPYGDYDDDTTLQGSFHDALSDWSQTGRGSHVDFGLNETIPLREGNEIATSKR